MNQRDKKWLVVIAIHSPEIQDEHDMNRVKEYIRDHKLPYAVPIDNEFKTWRKYENRYWPTLYLIDKGGKILNGLSVVRLNKNQRNRCE